MTNTTFTDKWFGGGLDVDPNSLSDDEYWDLIEKKYEKDPIIKKP